MFDANAVNLNAFPTGINIYIYIYVALSTVRPVIYTT